MESEVWSRSQSINEFLCLHGIAAHIIAHRSEPLLSSLAILLQSPLAQKDWLLSFYSRERLFSVAARREWLEPDLKPDDGLCSLLSFSVANGCAIERLQWEHLGASEAELGAISGPSGKEMRSDD